MRLSRSIKTGKSKHYAFVEFQFPQVAVIAAEAMNNYLMNGKVKSPILKLQCTSRLAST